MATAIKHGFQWFALRVKSNREKVTSVALEGKGYEVFLPLYRRQDGPDAGKERPLFPGYLFCCFDPQNRLPIVVIPGIVHIVGCGTTPIPVNQQELESIRVLLKAALPLNTAPAFSVGEMVHVISGPLAGAQGSIAGVTQQRFVVTITLLQRSVSVELNPDWITTAASTRLLHLDGLKERHLPKDAVDV
ncbi:MAG: transcriptional activator RfaH [Bryobacterales bacterium]|nr:transcriptional activator RfaH [Bryobacterales bacterium]